ncbi:MAG TPA: hypothetical protein VME63_04285 [Dyella sp.]|uniref:hypothetical protein n=1 Tax=Dyella sp. TaxID=1869338 RepID=UPI002CF61650|nr:hypothetical protein [Dyella sp.]HTV84597.1 hypothetical protein [Dyella sp.]
MLISRSDLGVRRSRFAWWRMLVWVLLLLAAGGGIENLTHAQQVWGVLRNLPPGDASAVSAMQGMLAWDVGFLVGWFALIVVCAGCILRQSWARPVLRLIALLLCALAAFGAWQQWTMLNGLAAASAASGQAATQLIDLRHVVIAGLGLRLIAAPVLLWLSWQLGQPAVRLQFKARRR